MIPNSKIPIYTDQNGSCASTNSQQYRSSVSLNPNLVVTQQQQPSRAAPHQTNSSNVPNNQLERIAATIQQNHSLHRPTPQLQSNQPTSISLDRSQLLRNLTTQSDNNSNIYQTLFLIQNYRNQTDKAKTVTSVNNNSEVTNDLISTVQTNPVMISNNVTQSNQNTTVVTMNNVQLLEAINRQSVKQNQSNTNMFIPSESVSQQLFNALQKQTHRSSNITSSPGYMVIGQSPNSIIQNNNNNLSSVNLSVVSPSLNSNNANEGNNVVSKNQANIQLWKFLDKLSNHENISDINRQLKMREMEENSKNSGKLANSSSGNMSGINCTSSSSSSDSKFQQHHLDQLTKSVSAPLVISSGSKLHHHQQYHQQPQIAAMPQSVSPLNPVVTATTGLNHKASLDTHQILRDSKETSILLSQANCNPNFTNDDMINQHFKKSLYNKYELKKSSQPDPAVTMPINGNNAMILSSLFNQSVHNSKMAIKTKSLIDLERPVGMSPLDPQQQRHATTSASNKPEQLYCQSNSSAAATAAAINKYSIKQRAESMVEDLLNNYKNNYAKSPQSSSANSNSYIPSNCGGGGGNLPTTSSIIPNHHQQQLHNSGQLSQTNSYDPVAANNQRTSVLANFNAGSKLKSINTNRRDNPSKSDLPLKKRIMLDFNENCTDDMDNDFPEHTVSETMLHTVATEGSHFNDTNSSQHPQATHSSQQLTGKVRRKRASTNSCESSLKVDAGSPCRGATDSHSKSYKTASSSSSSATAAVISGSAKKRRGRIPGTGKNQKLKEEHRVREICKLETVGLENNWTELVQVVNKPPEMDRIISRTLCTLDLEPLRQSKEPFFQIGSCTELAPRMVKCRSCRQNGAAAATAAAAASNETSTAGLDDGSSSVKSGSRDDSTVGTSATNTQANGAVSSFCRFHGFRKLQFSTKGTISQAGFCKTFEADELDLSLWRMFYPLPAELPVGAASYLLECLSGVFCQLMEAEADFTRGGPEESHSGSDGDNHQQLQKLRVGRRRCTDTASVNGHQQKQYQQPVWKRPVQGVREMCDVCETSIFNSHWACRKCGYSVCVDCYSDRHEAEHFVAVGDEDVENAYQYSSLQQHQHSGDNSGTNSLSREAPSHGSRGGPGAYRNRLYSNNHAWAVCTANRQSHDPDQLMRAELIPARLLVELRNRLHTVAGLLGLRLRCRCLRECEPAATEAFPHIEPSSASCENDLHLLADLALKEVQSSIVKEPSDPQQQQQQQQAPTQSIIKQTGIGGGPPRPPPVLSPPHQPESTQSAPTVVGNTISSFQAGNSSHFSWITVANCRKMLHLHHAQHPDNLKIFQQEWLRAHPLVVSGCHKSMTSGLWTPEKFLSDFENESVQLVDCETGLPVSKGSMRSFWEGFECVSKRISADRGKRPACLKLKDWPPADDFHELLPQRCQEILGALPLPQYTGRHGDHNLAGHLPDFFVRPDLGPKLYNAYGMPHNSKLGTTNLHMDIADAVNVLLYVGVPRDATERERQGALDTLEQYSISGCVDEAVLARARLEPPGALWHIFLPSDVPALRRFLSHLARERGDSVEPGHDPVHDQLVYLDMTLLARLRRDHQLEPCTIVQFRGDAVFIPAGAPHQVRNLHSCMKAANDFVSPENINSCLRVARELSRLSSSHANHEDKLQAKNMIFHSVKDAVSSVVMAAPNSRGQQPPAASHKRENQQQHQQQYQQQPHQ